MRNADDLYVPANRIEFVKRLPVFFIPCRMEYGTRKQIKSKAASVYERVKNILLATL